MADFRFNLLTFILEYTMIITQYGKNVDGDSKSPAKVKKRAGEGESLVLVADNEHHSEVAG